jgi:hypothetical protein
MQQIFNYNYDFSKLLTEIMIYRKMFKGRVLFSGIKYK